MKTPKIVGEARALTDGRGRKTGRIEVSFFGTFGISAIADTVDDATALCEDELRRLADNPCAYVYSWRGRRVLMFWNAGEWQRFRIEAPARDADDRRTERAYFGSLGTDRDKAERRVLVDLAQESWTIGDAMPEIVPESDRKEFQEWARFQTAYRAARDAGLQDGDAHNWACGSLARPDLVERLGNPYAVVPSALA